MPYPSPAEEEMAVHGALVAAGCVFSALGLIATLAVLLITLLDTPAQEPEEEVEIPVIYDSPAEEAGEDMTVMPQADGPFYNMPLEYEQTIVCDRQNREYVLVVSPEGGVAIVPYLDENGEQRRMPYA